jgi:small subunit ribosomal protein S2
MQPDDVTRIDTDLKLNGRITRDDWIGQARNMIEAAA